MVISGKFILMAGSSSKRVETVFDFLNKDGLSTDAAPQWCSGSSHKRPEVDNQINQLAAIGLKMSRLLDGLPGWLQRSCPSFRSSCPTALLTWEIIWTAEPIRPVILWKPGKLASKMERLNSPAWKCGPRRSFPSRIIPPPTPVPKTITAASWTPWRLPNQSSA